MGFVYRRVKTDLDGAVWHGEHPTTPAAPARAQTAPSVTLRQDDGAAPADSGAAPLDAAPPAPPARPS